MKQFYFLIVVCLSVQCTVSAADRTWTGTWNNRKYGTSGPLKCVARMDPSGMWQAVFSGSFKGDPFTYKVMFQSQKSPQGMSLRGKANISGHPYEWTGAMTRSQLKVNYRSTNGNNGTFSMKEVSSSEFAQARITETSVSTE